MFGKHLLFILLFAAALIGPAVYFNGKWPNVGSLENAGYTVGSLASMPVRNASRFDLSPSGLSQPVSTIRVASPSFGNEINPARIPGIHSPPAAQLPGTVILPGNAAGPDFNAVPLEFMPITNLGEIFRFDINQTWVRQRWDRVSVSTGVSGLSGLRVPLVTGVNSYDLFGSLTYYFDSNQVPQKITFRGWTGNANNLVEFVTTNYGLKNQPTSAAGLYIAKNWRKSTGALYMQHPNVIRAANSTQQVALLLELNNPNGPFELSAEVASMIFNSHR